MSNGIDFLKLTDVPAVTIVDVNQDYIVLLKKNTVTNQLEVKRIPVTDLGVGSSNFTRQTKTISVSSGQTTGSIIIGKTIMVIYVQVTQACRFRLYSSQSARNADLTRSTATFPNSNSGLMLEFIGVPGLLQAPISPGVISSNSETPNTDVQYFTVDSDTAVDIILSYIPIEN